MHIAIPRDWSEIIPKNSNYGEILSDPTLLKEAINHVYKDYPELLQLAEDYLKPLKLVGK